MNAYRLPVAALLVVAAFALLSFTTAARADESFERTLTSGSQPDLYVSTGSGNIRIYPGAGTAVRVRGHVHAGWAAAGDVQARMRRIAAEPPVAQAGNSIHVGEPRDRALYNNISIDYEIEVPRDVALNLHSGSGDIEVDHVGRFLAAQSGSGAVRAHGLHGTAEMQTGSGDIELEQEAPGGVKARTGSGSVRVHGLEGPLEARAGSGDIEVDGTVRGASELHSGSGSIRVHLSPDSHFNLNATTASGSLRVSLPGGYSGEGGRNHVFTGPINGGGAPLQISTGSGDVDVTPGGMRQ